VFNNSYDAPMITVRKFHPQVVDEVGIELDKFDFQVRAQARELNNYLCT
jgi:hypothetical protein